MKRTKSALSLRNLAMSIKQSIQLEVERTAKKEFIPLKNTKSLAQLMPKERNSQSSRPEQTLNREQKENRIFVLEKQITNLQKQLKETQNCTKDYSKQLNGYDQISKKLTQGQKDISAEKLTIEQLKNQILMLHEEISSTQFNIEERIAEKEYHEELIDSYENQYEAQSKLTINILTLQERNIHMHTEIKNIEKNIEKSKLQLQDWKKEIEFGLNEHKLKNNIKMVRMKLIGYEDQCDAFCSQNNLRKIRQLYCLYFKNYAKSNGIGNEEIEEGIDIFICKNGLSEDFSEFVRERLVYNKPKFALFQQYLQTLLKMEQIYRKSIFEANRKLHHLLTEDIKSLLNSKQEKQKEIQVNEQKIKEIREQIDDLFNNQSIAVIEYMREKNRNKYDLKEIKSKLRENKKEQKVRISKIRESFYKIKELEKVIEKPEIQHITRTNSDQIMELTQSLIQSQLQLEELEKRYSKLKRDKDQVENKISNEITRWREVDEKKNKLASLYQELESANKYEINSLQNFEFKRTKNQIEPTHYKKASYIDKFSVNPNPFDDLKSVKIHSKNTSIMSLNQSKSILSLSNPFKKMIQKSVEAYQPILSNCQMILSRKLTQKDLDSKNLESRDSKILHERISNFGGKTQDKSIRPKIQQNNKENNLWTTRNKSLTMTAGKQSVAPSTNNKGKVCISQRQSLSKLLISKFGR